MMVYATKLLIYFVPVNLHLLWLIMQLIALRKTVTTGFSAEAHHSRKILGELSEGIQD
jgi:hypothetical protein